MINETNDKIRYTSFKFFLEKGYESTNIRDICKVVDIKPSSLYFYYKSKQELFFSIYEEIWNKKLTVIKKINELNSNKSPDTRFELMYKQLIECHAKNILNEKFLLRYHMFPAEEIAMILKDRYKFWTYEEYKIFADIINECIEKGLLNSQRNTDDYFQHFKRFMLYQLTDMLIYNIKKDSKDQDEAWVNFWNHFISG